MLSMAFNQLRYSTATYKLHFCSIAKNTEEQKQNTELNKIWGWETRTFSLFY